MASHSEGRPSRVASIIRMQRLNTRGSNRGSAKARLMPRTASRQVRGDLGNHASASPIRSRLVTHLQCQRHGGTQIWRQIRG